MNDSLLGPDAVRQVRQLVAEQLANGRPAPERQHLRRRPTFEAASGVSFINDSGFEAPPHAVMEVVSIDTDGVYHITRPTGRREVIYLINRDTAVADEGTGIGDWGLSEPLKVLAMPTGTTYAPGDTTQNVHNRSYAPRAGYWHLRADNDEDAGGDANTENFGFKRVITTQWSDNTVAYDFGDDSALAYIIGGYFVQQIEAPEPSVTMQLSRYVFDTSWSEQTTLPASTIRYLRVHDDFMGKRFDRVGFETLATPSTLDPYLLHFFRSGVYRIDLLFGVTYEGNEYNTDIFTATATTTASGHTHNYDKMKTGAFRPATLWLNAKHHYTTVVSRGSSTSGTTTTLPLLREPFFFVNDTGGNHTFRRYLSFDLQVDLADYDPDTYAAWLRLEIEHRTANSATAELQQFDGDDDDEPMFLRVTRLREKEMMIN